MVGKKTHAELAVAKASILSEAQIKVQQVQCARCFGDDVPGPNACLTAMLKPSQLVKQ